MRNKQLKILAQVSLLVALALIIKISTSQSFFVWGVWARFNVAGVASQMVPILFGPLWGAASGAVVDILNFFISQPPPWLPHITALEMLSAILLWYLWKTVRIEDKHLKMFTVLFITDVVYTTLNTVGLKLFTPHMQGLSFGLTLSVRLGVAVLVTIVKADVMTKILDIYNKHIKDKA